jgi:acyl-CoA thioester hydrolase
MSNRKPAPRPEEFRFWSEERVRVSDTDLNGHVNNGAIGAYCETGRADLMNAVAGAPHERSFAMALARVAIDYRREVHYPNTVRIGGALLSMGNSSFTLEQALFVNDECVAMAENVFVIIDRASRKPIPIPPEAREKFLALAPMRVKEEA